MPSRQRAPGPFTASRRGRCPRRPCKYGTVAAILSRPRQPRFHFHLRRGSTVRVRQRASWQKPCKTDSIVAWIEHTRELCGYKTGTDSVSVADVDGRVCPRVRASPQLKEGSPAEALRCGALSRGGMRSRLAPPHGLR